MDPLQEWRVFLAVERRRSFTQAARDLRRSPQAVTRAIAALEARLGVRLFNRTTRSVSLTSAGEGYRERSRRALAEFDQLEAPADTQAELQGEVAVTASVLFGQRHLVPVVGEFLAAHPRLQVRLLLLDRVVSLAEEGIDLAVRIGPLPDSALRARLIGQVRLVVCASPAYLARAGAPRSPEALARHQCIAFTGIDPQPDRWPFPGDRGRERSVLVRPRLTVNTGQAAIDAAVAGLGLVRVLSYQITQQLAEKKLRLVLTSFEPPPRPIHIVHLPGVLSRAPAALIEFAAERLRRRIS